MRLFEERDIRSTTAILLLLLLFCLTYPLWHLGDRELFWQECEYALSVSELDMPPAATACGQLLEDSPMPYLLAAKALYSCGLPMEFTLRFLSVFPFFILTVLVFFICKRNCGAKAASAAAAVMFTTAIALEKLPEGYPVAMTTLLLYLGWMVWFEVGLHRSNWQMAWILTGFFAGLIFYNASTTGLVYFLVPLAMQRRPLKVWPKITGNRWGFFTGTAITLLFVLLWLFPRFDIPGSAEEIPLFASFSLGSYLESLLVFPADLIGRLFPWSLLLWAPFCAALIPLDNNPLFGKFHRVLFATLAILLWLNPDTRSRDLLYLIPLAATMLGTNYWVAVRRYGVRITSFCQIGVWIILSATACVGLYVYFPELPDQICATIGLENAGLPALPQTGRYLLLSAIDLTLAAACCLGALLLLRKQTALWLALTLLFCSIALICWTTRNGNLSLNREKQEFAAAMDQAMIEKENLNPANDTVYLNADDIYGLFGESYYSGFTIRSIAPNALPADRNIVYMVSRNVPDNSAWVWTRIHDTVHDEEKNTKLYIFRGQLMNEEDE